MGRTEFEAGEGQTLVVYLSEDDGSEIDAETIYAAIAQDAARMDRERRLRIVTMTSTPLRHAGTSFGRDGSGYETKLAVAVTYAAS